MTKPTHRDWLDLATREGKGQAPMPQRTNEGIDVKALYTHGDLDGLAHLGTLPGFAPFARGPRATMYTGRPWTIRQYAGFSTAEETNAFFRNALAAGQKGLSVAFDLPTHRGYDSDSDCDAAAADVGKAGVAIDTVEDMIRLFDGIPLGDMSVSMTMNGAVLPVMAAFIVAAEESGVSQGALTGTLQNDILKEFVVRNTYIYPPAPSLRITADIIAYTAEHMPRFNPVSISGYHFQEAGATATQELAYTLADGLEYVRTALDRGLDIDAFAPRLSFFFGIGMNLFMEAAKLRAARILWSELIARFHPKDPRSQMLRTHCQTSGVSLQAQDPYNNVVRTTVEALAAVLGGTQSLHTNSFDEALALPSAASSRLARNTQLILAEECGLTDVVDPLGGSFYVESLTASLVEGARTLIDEVEALGGMSKAIESGLPKARITESAARKQAAVDAGESVVIGVNKHQPDDPTPVELLRVDNAAVRVAQEDRLDAVRRNRDENTVTQALSALIQGARGDANLLTLTIEAMRARASVGEVSDALADVFGRHSETTPVAQGVYGAARDGEETYEAFKSEATTFAGDRGRAAKVYIAKLGQDGHDRGARMIAGAFSDAGLDVVSGPLFQTANEAAQAAIAEDVHAIGVSTQAGGHLPLVPEVCHALKAQGAGDIVVVCGGVIPEGDHQALYDAGVSAIYPPGTDLAVAGRDLLAHIRRKRNRP